MFKGRNRSSPAIVMMAAAVFFAGDQAQAVSTDTSQATSSCVTVAPGHASPTHKVLVEPAHTERVLIPAKTHTVVETIKDNPTAADHTGSSPSGNGAIAAGAPGTPQMHKVLVSPEHQEWVAVKVPATPDHAVITPKTYEPLPVSPARAAGQTSKDQAPFNVTYMLRVVPAQYRWETEASNAETPPQALSSKRVKTRIVTVVDVPEHEITRTVPAVYENQPLPICAVGSSQNAQSSTGPTPALQPAAKPATQPVSQPIVQVAPAPRPTPASLRTNSSSEPDTATASYLLGSGDKVHITVYGEPDLTGDFSVSGAGIIAFPLIGEVQAQGLTATQLQTKIASALMPNYITDARVNVEIQTFRPFYILGEVSQPGEYPYSEGLTVSRAIAKASGYTYRANHKKAFIKHAHTDTEILVEDVAGATIEPGDVIRIPERYF